MSDPYKDLPNLSGVTAATLEESRGGDPSRFFSQIGTGDSVTDRILSVHRSSVYTTVGVSIANATITYIDWNTVDYDPYGMWDPAHPSRLYAKTSALFLFTADMVWPTTAGGYRRQWFQWTSNGVARQRGYQQIPDAGGSGAIVNSMWPIPMNAGDYVELGVLQTSGSPLTYGAATEIDRGNGMTATVVSTFGSDN